MPATKQQVLSRTVVFIKRNGVHTWAFDSKIVGYKDNSFYFQTILYKQPIGEGSWVNQASPSEISFAFIIKVSQTFGQISSAMILYNK